MGKNKILSNDENIECLQSTAIALINLMPLAGGTLSSFLSDHLNKRKLEKIIDALQNLQKQFEDRDARINTLLNEDQVGELLERHLVEISITSDNEKIEFLKNSLANSLMSEDIEFDEKEFYLQVLKDMTIAEIHVLKMLYGRGDPFVKKKYPIQSEQNQTRSGSHTHGDLLNLIDNREASMKPIYVKDTEHYKKNGQSLESYFKEKFSEKWPLIRSACAKLDSKGLSNLTANLSNTNYLEIVMKNTTPTNYSSLDVHNYLASPMHNARNALGRTNQENWDSLDKLNDGDPKTPYEASRTDLGMSFFQSIND